MPSNCSPRRPISLRAARGSRNVPLIPLDDATSAGDRNVAAELLRLFLGREWPNHGAIIHAFVAEIGALNNRRHGADQVRILRLCRAERSLGISLGLLR